MTAVLIATAFSRDNGQYAQVSPEVKKWFNNLHNGKNYMCCSFADGIAIEDPDWRISASGTYEVYYHSHWLNVPEDALVHENNKIGHAVLWPVDDYPVKGTTSIRCFMPGAET